MATPKKPVSKKNQDQTRSQTNLKAKLAWQPHKTFELELVIPKEEVSKTYQKVLVDTAKNTTLKGFRKGKAPEKLVEAYVGKNALYEKVIQRVVTLHYLQALEQHKLQPMTSPKISVVSLKDDEDWVLKATACEAPDVRLGKWEEAVRGAKAVSKIWTPGSGEPATKTASASGPKQDSTQPSQESEDKVLGKIFEALLREAEVDLSPLLLEEETNRLLSRLLDQVNKLGLTIEQYLASQNKTSQQLREEYQRVAERSLKLEFILARLIQERKISVEAKEIEAMIQALPDPKERERLQNEEQKAYIASILRKRKIIDYLLKL